MSIYCIADWQQTPDGKYPAIPEGVGCLLLAEPQGTEFALLECELDAEGAASHGLDLVTEELCDLLNSAKQYPPAPTRARAAVRSVHASRSEFQYLLIERLEQYLSVQSTDPYILAKVRVSQAGYKHVGQYVWIVGYDSARRNAEVAWVSEDYYVYRDPIADFDVDAALLEKRFGEADKGHQG